MGCSGRHEFKQPIKFSFKIKLRIQTAGICWSEKAKIFAIQTRLCIYMQKQNNRTVQQHFIDEALK